MAVMSTILQEKVGDLVTRDFRTAPVFKKHRIDFCCGGGITIKAACERNRVDSEILETELLQVLGSSGHSDLQKISTYPLDRLVEHIELTHHRYVESRSSEIRPFLDKVVRVHGDKAPELAEIRTLFEEAVGELAQHMKKEELVLFPTIRRMVRAEKSGTPYEHRLFRSIEQPIHQMEDEHDTEGRRFREIERLTNDFNPPAWACNTFRVTYALLEEFQQDLHVHIHLENNILFPGAIALEKKLLPNL